jgi:hypothetical protein
MLSRPPDLGRTSSTPLTTSCSTPRNANRAVSSRSFSTLRGRRREGRVGIVADRGTPQLTSDGDRSGGAPIGGLRRGHPTGSRRIRAQAELTDAARSQRLASAIATWSPNLVPEPANLTRARRHHNAVASASRGVALHDPGGTGRAVQPAADAGAPHSPHSRRRSPDARAIGRSTAARNDSSLPTTSRRSRARVTAV